MPEVSTQNPLSIPPRADPFLKISWVQNVLMAASAVLILYGMIYFDVSSRAKEAYFEAEKYMYWNDHPQEKEQALNADFEYAKKELDEKLSKNVVDKNEYDRQIEILQFDRQHRLSESNLKYATIWYQTAYELFSPPETKWVRLAREKAPLAKEKWKAELTAHKIPYKEYMLD